MEISGSDPPRRRKIDGPVGPSLNARRQENWRRFSSADRDDRLRFLLGWLLSRHQVIPERTAVVQARLPLVAKAALEDPDFGVRSAAWLILAARPYVPSRESFYRYAIGQGTGKTATPRERQMALLALGRTATKREGCLHVARLLESIEGEMVAPAIEVVRWVKAGERAVRQAGALDWRVVAMSPATYEKVRNTFLDALDEVCGSKPAASALTEPLRKRDIPLHIQTRGASDWTGEGVRLKAPFDPAHVLEHDSRATHLAERFRGSRALMMSALAMGALVRESFLAGTNPTREPDPRQYEQRDKFLDDYALQRARVEGASQGAIHALGWYARPAAPSVPRAYDQLFDAFDAGGPGEFQATAARLIRSGELGVEAGTSYLHEGDRHWVAAQATRKFERGYALDFD